MSVELSDIQWLAEPIDGTTLETVAETISQMTEAATIEWFPRYDYETTGGVVSSAAVTVETRIKMPQWTGYSTATDVEQNEWDRFFAALRRHEQGHVELVVEHLSDVDELLTGKSIESAKQLWISALAALQTASRAYDQETDHGRKQGAIIDVTVTGP
ncbi:MAG TPA: DUF922 domain-containing protein [Candidatus Saccharimonadales bacterium]|nr:DUF922 domain-containing protein [Candidatus Saccharimonadales bacterium]